METAGNSTHREPWNKGKIVGQKAPFKLKDIWALRVRLQMESRVRELALFNLGIDSKLRGCDLVTLKVRDVCHGDQMAMRAIVMQHKTQRPEQFEITQATRNALQAWIKLSTLKPEDFLFPSRLHDSPHLGTRQYARILGHWVDELGLDRADYGTHSMRRTKATLASGRSSRRSKCSAMRCQFSASAWADSLAARASNSVDVSRACCSSAIRKEKDRLIARGLVKRDKPSVPVNIDEQPFVVPPSWNWVRVADVCSHVTDGEHATPQRCEDTKAIPLVTAKNVRRELMDYTVTDFVPSDVAAKCWLRCKPQSGDILMVSVGATLGRLCVLREPVDMVIVRSVTLLRPVHVGVFADYLALHLMSSGSQREIWSEVKQSAQPGLYLAKSAALKIALPPFAEQHRIVARVHELRLLCAQLRDRLTDASKMQSALADALVAQATAA